MFALSRKVTQLDAILGHRPSVSLRVMLQSMARGQAQTQIQPPISVPVTLRQMMSTARMMRMTKTTEMRGQWSGDETRLRLVDPLQ